MDDTLTLYIQRRRGVGDEYIFGSVSCVCYVDLIEEKGEIQASSHFSPNNSQGSL